MSPEVGTVGIVEWSVNSTITSAYIGFGRTTSADEHQAPVESIAGVDRAFLGHAYETFG